MSQKPKKEDNTEKNKKLLIILVIILVVVVMALVAVVAFLLGRNGSNSQGNQTQNEGTSRVVAESSRLVLDEESAATALDEMRKQVEEGMFECSMSTEWTFKDGKSESKDAYVANTVNNTHPFYFDVVLSGSDEVIYASPVIPVGVQLTDFKLDKPLEAGTYEAICKYYLLQDEENQEVISSANFIVIITVQN
jgi:hypothetical protein